MSMIEIVQDGERRKTSRSFFRGAVTNFYPRDSSLVTDDVIPTYIARGWMPKRRFITAKTPIVAFGSCFAANISRHLERIGFNVLTRQDNRAYITKMGDGIVNTFAVLQQFEWAWEGRTPTSDLWHGYDAAAFGYDETVRAETRALFDAAEVFVITLGLAEIWYDEPTGEVFWRAVPAEKYDPARHKFRLSSFAENLANLWRIHALIRRHRPDAALILTVSPIPLLATFRAIPCISANAASKAVLRAAVDEFHQAVAALDDKVFVFPSYEVVLDLFRHQWTPDRRHVYPHVLNFNMRLFERYFCDTGLNDAALLEIFRRTQALDQRIGRDGHAVVARRPTTEEPVAAKRAPGFWRRLKARLKRRRP